jgi:RNA polymerase sigma-70 factor (ECF subfamily)
MFTEQEFIAGILRKDESVIRAFIRMHQNYVYTLCLRICSDEMMAEEAAQDTFLQVIRAMDKFDGRSRLTTWMYTIAHNTSINKLRKSKKHLTQDLEQSELYQQPSDERTDQPLIKQQQQVHLEECLKHLPVDMREVITLFYFKELSIKEIGEITGDTDTNIKVKLHRGRKLLKTLLEKSVHGQIDMLYG